MVAANNGWSDYQKLVLSELARLNTCVIKIEQAKNCDHDAIKKQLGIIKDELKDDIGNLRADIAVLKFKSGLWGALAGAAPTALALLWYIVTQM